MKTRGEIRCSGRVRCLFFIINYLYNVLDFPWNWDYTGNSIQYCILCFFNSIQYLQVYIVQSRRLYMKKICWLVMLNDIFDTSSVNILNDFKLPVFTNYVCCNINKYLYILYRDLSLFHYFAVIFCLIYLICIYCINNIKIE